MQDGALNDLWIRLKVELLADKKKSAVMGGLVAVALVVGLKATLGSKTTPEAIAAAVSVAASTAPTPARSHAAERSRELAEYIEKMDTTVTRDLFAAALDAYPVVKTDNAEQSLGKSPAEAADNSGVPARLRQEAEVRRLAGALNLQSTMTGEFPTAIINGQVVAQGQRIGDFVVRDISPGACVVTRGTVKITLKMAQ